MYRSFTFSIICLAAADASPTEALKINQIGVFFLLLYLSTR